MAYWTTKGAFKALNDERDLGLDGLIRMTHGFLSHVYPLVTHNKDTAPVYVGVAIEHIGIMSRLFMDKSQTNLEPGPYSRTKRIFWAVVKCRGTPFTIWLSPKLLEFGRQSPKMKLNVLC